MTTEQKAKAYDKALKKARQLCGYPTTKPFISDLQDLFPELCESEDERMKKSIIQTLKKYSKCVEDGNDSPSAKDFLVKDIENQIAWLEKQKEPELSEDLGEYVTELNKQFPEISFAKLSRIAVRVKNWLEKQGEQKPAWSKEDEKMFNGVVLDLKVFRDKDSGKEGKGAYQREIDWLKSIKQRIGG